MSGPGIVPRLSPKIVMNVDLAPTILDLAGVGQIPSDGLSLGTAPRRDGDAGQVRRLAGAQVLRQPARARPLRVLHASWVFVRYDDDNGTQEEELYNLVRANE